MGVSVMIEQLLRTYAEAGKFSHLSVYAQWGAHNSPTVFHASFITPYGQGHGDSTDPVAAITEAIEKAPKQAQRHTPVVHQKEISSVRNPVVSATTDDSGPLAYASVMGQPSNTPKGLANTRIKPIRGQTDIVVPNLMELWK